MLRNLSASRANFRWPSINILKDLDICRTADSRKDFNIDHPIINMQTRREGEKRNYQTFSTKENEK